MLLTEAIGILFVSHRYFCLPGSNRPYGRSEWLQLNFLKPAGVPDITLQIPEGYSIKVTNESCTSLIEPGWNLRQLPLEAKAVPSTQLSRALFRLVQARFTLSWITPVHEVCNQPISVNVESWIKCPKRTEQDLFQRRTEAACGGL